MDFGQFVRARRLELGLTLREFCKESGYDSGYISRLENSLVLPPESEEKLKRLASALGIQKGTPDWVKYHDLRVVARRQIPKEIDSRVLNFLPAFFRKSSKGEVTKADVEKLVNLIKGSQKE